MTDRELLELAAKAAGNGARFRSDDAFGLYDMLVGNSQSWNPLDDDGDALRLAVKLDFAVVIKGHECEVFSEDGQCLSSVPILGASCFVNAAEATNPYAATRRAIVRAAAAIGASR